MALRWFDSFAGNMIYRVIRPVSHPVTRQIFCAGDDIELSYAHAEILLESGVIQVPVIRTKEEKSIYGKAGKSK